ncbi:unnamed protein product, partial [Prorocentrum cordatum]
MPTPMALSQKGEERGAAGAGAAGGGRPRATFAALGARRAHRLAKARYGMAWHVDSARHVVRQVGWALFGLARLRGFCEAKLAVPGGQSGLLRADPALPDARPALDWAMELRGAMVLGLVPLAPRPRAAAFLLARVLRQGDVVCDFGAFGGHYSRWLNDTGLVTALAFDGLHRVTELTRGRVRHARLDAPGLRAGRCDVALCLEVLEHVPRPREAAALQNLARHARRALVLSWAPPWVPGEGHVNQRTPEEARRAVAAATGLRLDPGLTAEAAGRAEVDWLAESVA